MRKSDITPKIIELARKIAEHERMDVYEGCWVCVYKYWRVHPENKELEVFLVKDTLVWWNKESFFPIPTISDALRKLGELNLNYRLQEVNAGHEFGIWDDPEDEPLAADCKKQPLESVLTALLQTLESREGK